MERGGALFAPNGSLLISACNFTNNVALSGGAIYGSHLEVSDDSLFVGNRAEARSKKSPRGRSGDAGDGGAVSIIF